MRNFRFLKKAVGLTACAMLCLAMPMQVGATEFAGSVSEGDIPLELELSENEVSQVADTPDVVGLTIEEAQEELADYGEVIIEYAYSDTVDVDVVISQELVEDKITLTVSLGVEPEEDLYIVTREVDKLSSFGLSAYSATPAITIDGNFDDWADKPYSYEYDWDNSGSCWYYGVWGGGLQGYKTPEGTYDDNVRNKISFFVDGEYAYLYVKIAKCSGRSFSGYDYRFFDSTGQYAFFNVVNPDKSSIRLGSGMNMPGVHEVSVLHGTSQYSYTQVEGAKAYLKINDDYQQSELELKIPLSQMELQNPNMTREHMDTMQFANPHLTQRRVTASGAGTAPFVAAGIALIGVPASVMILKRKSMKKQKKEQ